MELQNITINIPKYEKIPDKMKEFTAEENMLMLLIGINAVTTVKDMYIDTDLYKEIEQKIKNTYQKVIDEREQQNKELHDMNISIKSSFEEATTTTLNNYQERLQEGIKRETQNMLSIFEKQLQDKNNELERYREKQEILHRQLTESRIATEQVMSEKYNVIQNELLKVKTDFNEYKVVIEKRKNEELSNILQKNAEMLNESMRTIEDLKKEKNACNTVKGTIGENYICELIKDTFYDFENFSIIPTAKISHSGDFIMNFKNFSILIDSKNYTNGVGKKEVKKLTDDINNNKHIKIAWLVSLHTPINGYSTNPVMYDIKDNVCYCYINSLNKNENPQNFLKTIWFCCSFIFEKILNVDSGEELLNKYKKNEIRIKNIVEKMLKKSKERAATLIQLKDNFDETDRDLKELLNDEIISVYEEQTETVKNWWYKNIKKQENHKLKSKGVYEKFISNEDNKVLSISIDAFKMITKSFLCDADILTKGKTDKAEYTYLNVDYID
jgi:hypothetical protein